ncbi:MAG: gamma-butyrobetaine hydroxylase-like domain-containing protein [Comamonas sp.]
MADMPLPESLTVHEASRVLEIGYSDGQTFRIPFELMRVYSPSAEVQGHGPGQEVLQTGKRHVSIVNIEQVGNYAIKPFFSDGHESGLFTWNYLYELGQKQDELWAEYFARLQEAGVDRDTPMPEKSGGSCGTGGASSTGGGCGSGSCGCH